jgi:hypothetical protein
LGGRGRRRRRRRRRRRKKGRGKSRLQLLQNLKGRVVVVVVVVVVVGEAQHVAASESTSQSVSQSSFETRSASCCCCFTQEIRGRSHGCREYSRMSSPRVNHSDYGVFARVVFSFHNISHQWTRTCLLRITGLEPTVRLIPMPLLAAASPFLL